jgi:hypothetical protein
MRQFMQAIYMNNGIHPDGLIVSVHTGIDEAYKKIQEIGAALAPVVNQDKLPYGVRTIWIDAPVDSVIGQRISNFNSTKEAI